jgi:glutathione S-transferase
LLPQTGTQEYEEYLQWLHYAEGSAALPLMLKLYTSRLSDGGAELQPRISDEMGKHLGYLDQALEGVDWFVGNKLSGADIQLSFVAEIAPMLHTSAALPNLAAFKARCHARPAYRRALDRGGVYAYGPADA